MRAVEADAATYRRDEPVDCVYFSYSLAMILDWRSAMDNALAMLRPGGILVHLGTRACQAERLLDFLREYESEHLFLVGDVVDFWAMRRGAFWSTRHNTVVQKILKRARHGTDVVFVPGTHDEALREHIGISFGHIRLLHDHIHTAADGKRYLLTHGDDFDQVTKYHRWAAVLGDQTYAFVVRLNALLFWVRRRLGIAGYWSLAGYAKRKVKGAVSFIFDKRFEGEDIGFDQDRVLSVVCIRLPVESDTCGLPGGQASIKMLDPFPIDPPHPSLDNVLIERDARALLAVISPQ